MMLTFKFRDQIYRVSMEEGDQTEIEIESKRIPLEFRKIDGNFYSIIVEGKSIGAGILRKGRNIQVFIDGDLFEFEAISERERAKAKGGASGTQEIKAPMPSRVVKILKREDEEVEEGEGVIVIEAMKMESELKSPMEGKIREVRVKEGDTVESGVVLVVISPNEASQ
ncbi:Glutaconyl-CoA decarboxylase subunit gamma [bacterium HR37]|nr:Glutaconyl-CoA decarboxylase subunit gamma [bacterium HR37]